MQSAHSETECPSLKLYHRTTISCPLIASFRFLNGTAYCTRAGVNNQSEEADSGVIGNQETKELVSNGGSCIGCRLTSVLENHYKIREIG